MGKWGMELGMAGRVSDWLLELELVGDKVGQDVD